MRCPDSIGCRARLIRAIQHFASREALDIHGLGPATVEALVNAGLIRSVCDLFVLTDADLRPLEEFGAVSAVHLAAAIDAARRIELTRLLNGLGSTSNLGSEHFRKLTSPLGFLSRGVGVEQVQGEVRRELERRFPPEFLNRIDEVVLFSPLMHHEAREIAKHYVEHVRLILAKSGKTIRVDDDALELIVTQGHSLAFGARFLKRVIDERIKLPVCARWREGSHFHVCVRGHEVVVELAHEQETASEPASAYLQVA